MKQPLPFENAAGSSASSPQPVTPVSRVGRLGTAVIVFAVVWTVSVWLFTLWVTAGYAAGLWILAVATAIALPFWIPVVRTISQAQDALASRAAASDDVRW